ncbi:MAG TPA: mechanosensitive ion channel [Candidatus Rifleibacterium sp.]|nr:mechanosensitive ion channel [Candidatus Rifleibacterium sp.]
MLLSDGVFFVLLMVLVVGWRAFMHRMARKAVANESSFTAAIEMPGYLLAVSLPFYIYCRIRDFDFFRPDAFALAQLLLNASLVLLVGEVLFFGALRSYARRKAGQEFPSIFRQLLKGIVYVILILSFLSNTYKIDITPLLTTSAVFTMVLGLALQDVLGNLFAGLSVHISPPFRIGDWIKINGYFGRVEESNWRATTLRQANTGLVVIPNNQISKNEIVNFSDASGAMFHELSVGLPYDVSPERLRRILSSAAREVEEIYQRPAPVVSITNFGDSAIDYRVRFWISNDESPNRILSLLSSRIWYRLKREGLSIPFPIRDVFVHHEQDDREKTIEHRLSLISGIDFIAALDQKLRVLVAERFEECWYETGEHVVTEGSFDTDFFVIDRGRVQVFVESAGQKAVAELGEGEFFGEMSLLTGEKRSASVVAKTEIRLLKLNRDTMGRLLSEDHLLAEKLSHTLAERSSRNTQIVADHHESKVASQKQADETVAKAAILRRIRGFFKL